MQGETVGTGIGIRAGLCLRRLCRASSLFECATFCCSGITSSPSGCSFRPVFLACLSITVSMQNVVWLHELTRGRDDKHLAVSVWYKWRKTPHSSPEWVQVICMLKGGLMSDDHLFLTVLRKTLSWSYYHTFLSHGLCPDVGWKGKGRMCYSLKGNGGKGFCCLSLSWFIGVPQTEQIVWEICYILPLSF